MSEPAELRDCPHETFENIPWLVTGRVSRELALAAEGHIAQCASCQRELALQRRLHAAMSQPDTVEYAPQASLHKLEARIEELERELPADAGTPGLAPPTRAAPVALLQGSRWVRPLLLAQAAALVLVTGLLLWLVSDRLTAARFQTATATDAINASALQGAAGRLVVAPDVTVAQFAALVQASQARVVDGPSGQNAWTVLLPGVLTHESLEQSLSRLRADARVSLAEPVAGSAP
ncbi:MAG TPA: hypothetical protein VF315_06365 [Steroidobacteraceae bacterium]